jgi:hypothetical protein
MPKKHIVLVIVFAAVLGGGTVWAKKKSTTPVTAGVKQLQLSPQELRIRVRALIRPTVGTVEEASDRVIRETADPVVRRSVLTLKIEATTTLLAAMLRNDPLLALADAWGYVVQVELFLARPEVAARYGDHAPEAGAAVVTIQKSFREFAGSLQPGLTGEALEAKVRAWAEKNPIEGALYRRPAVDAALAHVMAESSGGGALAVLGTLDETTADVLARLDLYTMYLPRLARWEGELAVDDVTSGIDMNGVTTELTRFTRAADRIAAAAEGAPQLIAGERAATLEAVAAERRAVLGSVHDERIATMQEIEAIAQRLVDHSSGPLHDAMNKDLADLVESVEAMRKRLIAEAGVTLNEVVDHAFVRAVQLLLMAAALAAVGLVVYARFLRR